MYEALVRVINELRARASALAVGVSMAMVSAASGFISYTHICALTLSLGGSWKTGHLMPLAVDGQIIIGSAYFMDGKNRWQKAGGLVLGVAPGIGESLFANWESGIGHGLLAAGWSTVPAQAFACSMIMFERWLKNRARPAAATAELSPQATEPAAPGQDAGPGGQPQGAGAPAAAPAPLAGVPVLGPVMMLSDRPRPARRAPAARAAEPAGDRPPLPQGAELEALIADESVSANEMARRYDVSRWTANLMKKQYAEEVLGREKETAGVA
jgi:hypothetical protein